MAYLVPATKQPALTQQQKRDVLAQVRELTNHGLHLQASLLYNTHFPL